MDVRAKREADLGSDPHLVVGMVRLKLGNYNNKNLKVGYTFNTELLKDQETKQKFHVELSNHVEALLDITEEDASMEQCWEQTRDVWKETCETVLGRRKKQHKEWITVGKLSKIKERKECKTALNSSKTRAAKAEAQQRYNEKTKK